jgi:hypothetical protein
MDAENLKPWDVDMPKGQRIGMILGDYFATIGKYTFVVNLHWIA